MSDPNARSFSVSSDAYAAFRPEYPAEWMDWLAGLCGSHDLAWDCGCGNGQATRQLASRFARVIATDVSAEQIAAATPQPGVEYRVASAEAASLAPESLDLVIAAQAFHWFDAARFYASAASALRPGGVLAIFGYGFLRINPQVDGLLQRFLLTVIDPFWAPGNRLVINGYRDVVLPFPEIVAPPAAIMEHWSLDRLLAYCGTWSAVKRMQQETGRHALDAARPALSEAWGIGEQQVTMPLVARVCRKP